MRGDAERQANCVMLAVTPDSFIPVRPPDPPHQRSSMPRCEQLSPLFGDVLNERAAPARPARAPCSSLLALYSIRSERQFCSGCAALFKWFLVAVRRLDLLHRESSLPMSRAPSSPRWWPRQSGAGCSPPTTSRWTGRCWRPGPRSRATARATSGATPGRAATRMSTSGGGGAAVIRILRHGRLEARLYTKGSGQTAKLSYLGHQLTENRHGLAGCGADRGERVRRARGGGQMLERSVRLRDAGRRPRLTTRATSWRRCRARERDAARGAKRPGRRSAVDGRSHAASRLPAESEATQDRGAFSGLRLDEDRGRRAQAALRGPRAQPRLAGTHRRRLQRGAYGRDRDRHGVGAVRPPPGPGALRSTRSRSGGRDQEAGGGLKPPLATPRPRKAQFRVASSPGRGTSSCSAHRRSPSRTRE